MEFGSKRHSFSQPSLLGNIPFLVIIVAGIAACLTLMYPESGFDPSAEPRLITPRGDLAADEQSTIELFERLSSSVVYIHTTALVQKRSPFSMSIQEEPFGEGSGFVWDDEGHIVTNAHVILDANNIFVRFSDQSSYQAKLVGRAADKDLAVLYIDAPKSKLNPIAIGESSILKVGQKVFAIGNPFGFDQSLSTGVVSALGRQIESIKGTPIYDVIQTDAAINPGNSGGPLLDSAGRLIGVNTAIKSTSGSSAGVGFAVPVDTVNTVVPVLIRRGSIGRPGLGVMIAPVPLARRIGVTRGGLIDSVVQGSAAERAGLRGTRVDATRRTIDKLGDIILAINGVEIRDSREIPNELARYNVGDDVVLTVLRDDDLIEVDVRLQSLE